MGEEAGDFVAREAQVLRGQDFRLAGKRVARNVDTARHFPAGDGQVQVGGRVPHDEVDHPPKRRIRQLFGLVQRKNHGSRPLGDRIEGPRRIGIGCIAQFGIRAEHVEPCRFEGVRDVNVNEVGRVAAVQDKPGHGQTSVPGVAAARRQQRRLAEAGRRNEQRATSRCGGTPACQGRPEVEADRRIRDRYALPKQPGWRTAV